MCSTTPCHQYKCADCAIDHASDFWRWFSWMEQWWEEEEESDEEDYCHRSCSSSEMNHEKTKKRRRGSIPGRIVVPRDIFSTNLRIVKQYFADPPMYNAKYFQRRFRMSRELFLRIVEEVEAHDNYFTQRTNAVGLLGPLHCRRWLTHFACLHTDFQLIMLMTLWALLRAPW